MRVPPTSSVPVLHANLAGSPAGVRPVSRLILFKIEPPLIAFLALLLLGLQPWIASAQEEEVLFFDARADQTGSTNGGTAIWSLKTNTWRWWYQNVSQANVSPDGKSLVYVYQNNVYLTNLKGQNPKLLSAQSSYPVWSPQGDKIALIANEGALRIISPDGKVLKSFPGFGARPSWSPDGKRIAYEGGVTVSEVGCELFPQDPSDCFHELSTIFTLDTDTGISAQLFTPSYSNVKAGTFVGGPLTNTTYTTIITEIKWLGRPAWSPDGSRIAAQRGIRRYTTYPPPGSGITEGWKTIEASVVTIPASGGDPTPVTPPNTPPYETVNDRYDVPGAWSADGRLFYTRTIGASVPVAEQGTYVSPGGSGPGTKVNGFIGSNLQWAKLNPTGVTLEILLPKARFRAGETFDATVRVTLSEDQPRTVSFVQTLLKSLDPAVLKVSTVALPAAFQLSPTNSSKSFTVSVLATNEGTTELVSTISTTNAAGVPSEQTVRSTVKVIPGGDLLIRRDEEPVAAAGLNDVYQTAAAGAQVRSNTVFGGEPSVFDVEIQNDDPKPQVFRLVAIESDTSKAWEVKYMLYMPNETNISSQLRTLSGLELPILNTNQSLLLQVQMRMTNPAPAKLQRVTLALSTTNTPSETLDVVEAVSELREVEVRAIEVNQVVQDWLNSVPLIAGKPTLVRVFLQTPPGIGEAISTVKGQLRGFRDGHELEISPLLTSSPNGYAEATPDAAKGRSDLSSSLNFYVPRDWLHGAVKLQVELTNVIAKFTEPAEPGGNPKDGIVNVNFKDMPGLPVTFYFAKEISESGTRFYPDQSQFADLIRRITAMYPVARLDWTLGAFSPLVYSREISNSESFFVVYDQVKPTASYINCTHPVGCPLQQVLLPVVTHTDGTIDNAGGLAEGRSPGLLSAARLYQLGDPGNSAVHELAHTLGRPHTFPAGAVPYTDQGQQYVKGTCNEGTHLPADFFPFYESIGPLQEKRPTLGPLSLGEDSKAYGLEFVDNIPSQAVNPSNRFDLMSYCGPLVTWPSTYTYQRLMEAIEQRFGGTPRAALPVVHSQSSQTYLVIRGSVNLSNNAVSMLPIRRVSASSSTEMQGAGPYSLELRGPSGTLIRSLLFLPTVGSEGGSTASFFFVIPDDPNLRQLLIKFNGVPLLTQTASAHPPIVHVLSPNGGENISSNLLTVRWEASDPDGDPLRYFVDYSADGGASWDTLAVDWTETECTVPRTFLKGGSSVLVRVEATDGLLSGSDVSDGTFRAANNPPLVFLSAPSDGQMVVAGRPVSFEAMVFDPEDGQLSGTNVTWTSSLNGPIGTGLGFDLSSLALTPGNHQITVTVMDSAGNRQSASISLTVALHNPPQLMNLLATTPGELTFTLSSETSVTNVIETSSDLSHWQPVLTNVTLRGSETITLQRPTGEGQLFIRGFTR